MSRASNLAGFTTSITSTTNLSAGIITATSFVGSGSGLTGVGIGSTGNVNTSGIITATSFFGNGSGLTGVGIGSTGNINTSGIITATSFFGNGSGLTGVGIGSTGSINTVGIITATSFFGNGSGLTGAGSTVSDDTSTNSTFYPLFTATTSGTVTASKVSTTKLSFNPSTGTLNATNFVGALSGNSTTATTLQTSRNINGVSFNGSANIDVNPTSGAYSNGYGAKTVSTSGPSGGTDGDIWYQY